MGTTKKQLNKTRKKREELQASRMMAQTVLSVSGIGIVGFGGFAMYKSRRGEDIPLGPFRPAYDAVAKLFESQFGELYQPVVEKLLPDRPKHYPPSLPVLVLDLEQTIVQSAWDRRHGWRSVKRPGLDNFLDQLKEYYEIVLFSPTGFGIASATVDQLDPEMKYFSHRLFRESTLYKNGHYVKDLSRLNRPLSRTVVIDDDENAFSLHKENGIKVKPFKDINDKNDTTLQDLVPFLIRLARKPPSTDLRQELKRYEGRDLVAAVHEEIVQERKEAEKAMNSGLGGAIRRNYQRKMPKTAKKTLASMAPANRPAPGPVSPTGAAPAMSELPPMAPLGSTPLQSVAPAPKKSQIDTAAMLTNKKGSKNRRTLWEWIADQQKAAQIEQERLFREQHMNMQQQRQY